MRDDGIGVNATDYVGLRMVESLVASRGDTLAAILVE